MKTIKLLLGIITIVLSIFFAFASCAANMAFSIAMGGANNLLGIIISILMFAGGIALIATRSYDNDEGAAICASLFAIAAIIGFISNYTKLNFSVLAWYCEIVAIILVVAIIVRRKKVAES